MSGLGESGAGAGSAELGARPPLDELVTTDAPVAGSPSGVTFTVVSVSVAAAGVTAGPSGTGAPGAEGVPGAAAAPAAAGRPSCWATALAAEVV